MDRAYSFEKEVIASPVDGDALTYVMSDETVDRVGDVIEAKGWILDNFSKNPVALFGHDHTFVVGHWSNVRVQGGKLIGKLNLLPQGISERLDEVIAAVKAGVLRAVSVGFSSGHDSIEPMKNGGVRFKSAELMECSLVSVPANPNALQMAKSLNLSEDVKSLIFRDPSDTEYVAKPAATGTGEAAVAEAKPAVRVVKLSDPARVRAKPFVIKKIHV